MLIGISGPQSSGKAEVARFLGLKGFQEVRVSSNEPQTQDNVVFFADAEALDNYVTANWQQNFVLPYIDSMQTLTTLQVRPFFLHVTVESPLLARYQRYQAESKDVLLDKFIELADIELYSKENPLIEIINQADIKVVNVSNSSLFDKLEELNLLDTSRLRPTWDAYFMRLADLAALRSNCMKRRVGCVIVRGNRVVATGYNGTPRNLTNCNEGGCKRCNSGSGQGLALATCLCLHAEENALLESGRDRINGNGNEGSVLYCNTCPCLTCSIKIVQSGIKEVVYAKSYYMDTQAHSVMKEANIVLRQYQPPQNEIFI